MGELHFKVSARHHPAIKADGETYIARSAILRFLQEVKTPAARMSGADVIEALLDSFITAKFPDD
jgi:hypothetical protein